MKKILCSVFFALVLFNIFTSKIFAQTTTPHPTTPAPKAAYPLNTDQDVPQNFHTYTQNVFIEILSTATCFVGGVDMLNPGNKCLGINPTTKKIGYVESSGGLTMVVGNMIGSTFDIPVSSSSYVRDLASHFGISRSSFASQPADPSTTKSNNYGFGTGIGYVGLTPVLNIWKTFRNLTYLLFVLFFVIMGLGIMFRINIDARTVMTVQNQIPKVIIGLLLITFSYAIAGFLIDMMYVSIYLSIHIFQSQGLTTLTHIDTNPVMAIGPLGGINDIAAPAAQGVGGMVRSLFSGSIGNWVGGIVVGIIGTFIGGSLLQGLPGGGLIGGAVGAVIGLVAGSKILGLIATAIAYLIIAVAILSTLFRVWFMLIKAYIFIFLDVIFAPFWIVGGIIPGAPGGAGPWFRSLLANLSAFPTVIILFMIGKTIQDQAIGFDNTFVPPLIGNPGSSDGIAAILGLGVILIMPEAVNITKSAFKAPEQKLASAAGKAIGVGTGVVQAGRKKVQGALWYTNPKTGDAGRLKAWTGQKLLNGFEKLPGSKKIKNKLGAVLSRDPRGRARQAYDEDLQRREILSAKLRQNAATATPNRATGITHPPDITHLIDAKARDLALKGKVEIKPGQYVTTPAEFDQLQQWQKEVLQRTAEDHLRREAGYVD